MFFTISLGNKKDSYLEQTGCSTQNDNVVYIYVLSYKNLEVDNFHSDKQKLLFEFQ